MNEYSYARAAARALILLRQDDIDDISKATGVARVSLASFLEGNDAALSDASFQHLFQFFGVVGTEQGARLTSDRVHYFHLHGLPLQRRHDVRLLRVITPMLDALTGMTLPARKGVTPILIRGRSIRAVLLVKSYGLPLRLKTFGLLPGQFAGHEHAHRIPDSLLTLVCEKQIRTAHFDLIIDGDFSEESLNLVQLAALDRNVTLTQIVRALKEGRISHQPHPNWLTDADDHLHSRVVALFPQHFRPVVDCDDDDAGETERRFAQRGSS